MIKSNLLRTLGEKLISQSTLSKMTRIRPGTINLYYHGYIKRINVRDLDKICTALNCRLEDVIEFIPNNK